MRIRLVFKIFLAFFLTSMVVIMLMTGIMRYIGQRNFENFVNRMDMERLSELDQKLRSAYMEHGSWEFLRQDPRIFIRMIRPERPAFGPPGGMNARPSMGMGRRGYGPGESFRISLFDDRKRPVAGRALSPENHILKEITVDGRTVGWLGLRERKDLTEPLEAGFLYRQTRTFVITGFVALVLSGLVSFLLSRHLLRPVDALTRGADSLADRKFDTRITVETGDELGRLADNFNRMAQTLERYELLRRQWISDISHELRTPLAILRAEIEAIQDGVRETNAENLESLHAEIIRMSSMVDDLHELSLADSGDLPVKNEPLDVLSLLQEALALFAPRFSQAGITVEHDLRLDEEAIITADRGRLFQVFSNLLENSVRYTEPGGLLKVRLQRAADRIYVCFEDSKPGVPGESLEKIFDRLYRVDESRSRRIGGTGLGLAICRSIVEALGGGIRAYHSGFGGLGIEITLPLDRSGKGTVAA